MYLAAGDPLLAASAGARGLQSAAPDAAAPASDAPVFIDDAAVESGETITLADASSATRIEPRLRERRIAVKRAAGRKRLRWVFVAVAVVVLVIAALAVLGPRPVTLARELTKQFEEVVTVPAEALPAWLGGAPQRTRGEFVVLLHPIPVAADDGESLRVLRLLLQELPLKTAVRLAADITGASRNVLYDTALAWKRSGAHGDEEAQQGGGEDRT